MIVTILEFKNKLEQIKSNNLQIDSSTICKLLIMANMAEMAIRANIKIINTEKYYFEGQAFVGRYFSDWGYDDIAKTYFEITDYIKNNNW